MKKIAILGESCKYVLYILYMTVEHLVHVFQISEHSTFLQHYEDTPAPVPPMHLEVILLM